MERPYTIATLSNNLNFLLNQLLTMSNPAVRPTQSFGSKDVATVGILTIS